MTRDEFKSWIDYHSDRFPGYAAAIVNRDLDIWYDITFSALDFELCKQTSDEMVRGEIDHPKTFDLDRLPGVIRENVHRLLAMRRTEQSEFQREQREHRKKRWQPKSGEIATSTAYLALVEFRRNLRAKMLEGWVAEGNERRDFQSNETEINRLAHIEATRLFDEGVSPEHEKRLLAEAYQSGRKGIFQCV